MDAKQIGRHLRRLRGDQSAGKVADALQISRSALAMYERGDRIPRDEVKVRIAEYYGEPVQKIFFAQKSTICTHAE